MVGLKVASLVHGGCGKPGLNQTIVGLTVFGFFLYIDFEKSLIVIVSSGHKSMFFVMMRYMVPDGFFDHSKSDRLEYRYTYI